MLALAGALALPSAASAAVFAVDRSDDPGGPGACGALFANDCSLRQAVALAAQAPDADTITLQAATLTSEIAYSGSGMLTIRTAGASKATITANGSGALHVLPGAGAIVVDRVRFQGYGPTPAAPTSLLTVESTSSGNLYDVDFEHLAGPAIGAIRIAPTLSIGSLGVLDFSSVDAPIVIDHAIVTMRGGAVRISGSESGVTATGGSTLHLASTSVSTTTASPLDLGDGALVLRHATLSTTAAVPIVAALSGASIDAGFNLLIGGTACFASAAASTSAGSNLSSLTALQCPALSDPTDMTGLADPTLAGVDLLATCGDNGDGGDVDADRWSLRPVDGNGDGFPRCDVGAREHGTDGVLSFTEGSADVHVGDPVTATLVVQRGRSPEGSTARRAEITIAVPTSLTLVRATPTRGMACAVSSAAATCSVADASADVPLAGASITLELAAVATTGTSSPSVVAGMTDVLTSADGITSTSRSPGALFGTHVTPAPPPLIVDPPIVKHFPNAYAGCTIVGTSGSDHLVGTARSDVICALGGNDVIDGKGAGDHIIGGDGKDRIDGGAGKDWIEGGPGNDRLHGGAGADVISGGLGRDRIWGGAGDDRLSGGRGFDVLDGQAGKDRATGAAHDRTKRIEHGAARRKRSAKKS